MNKKDPFIYKGVKEIKYSWENGNYCSIQFVSELGSFITYDNYLGVKNDLDILEKKYAELAYDFKEMKIDRDKFFKEYIHFQKQNKIFNEKLSEWCVCTPLIRGSVQCVYCDVKEELKNNGHEKTA